ncbi:MAG: 30S ribosomal protein S9 [Deltaproteobacteria bacterium]|nr:30S ribosomal protein S9 [Deltaproteobacteria bacterium]
MPERVHAGVGGRKTSTARVYLREGSGKIVVNKHPLEEAFKRETLCMTVRQPLELVGLENKLDVTVTARGGGLTGQAEATRLGIARALLSYDPNFRPILKKGGFLTRDARIVERKKYGLRKARRATQFTKR